MSYTFQNTESNLAKRLKHVFRQSEIGLGIWNRHATLKCIFIQYYGITEQFLLLKSHMTKGQVTFNHNNLITTEHETDCKTL